MGRVNKLSFLLWMILLTFTWKIIIHFVNMSHDKKIKLAECCYIIKQNKTTNPSFAQSFHCSLYVNHTVCPNVLLKSARPVLVISSAQFSRTGQSCRPICFFFCAKSLSEYRQCTSNIKTLLPAFQCLFFWRHSKRISGGAHRGTVYTPWKWMYRI